MGWGEPHTLAKPDPQAPRAKAHFHALDIPACANGVPVVLVAREGTGSVVALRVGEAIDLYKAGRLAGWKPGGGPSLD
jgi:hypothetical protein